MRSPEISSALSKMRRLRSESLEEGILGEKTRLLSKIQQTSTPPGDRSLPEVTTMFAPGLEPPPLVVWLTPALVCALCYALYNIFIKKGSASIHPILGGVILQIVAAFLGAGILGFLVIEVEEKMFYDTKGIAWAILAGLAVGAAEILSFLVNGMGVPAVQSIPVIIGGSVMFGTIIGRIFLAEVLSLSGWFGVILIAIGITLVGMESEGEM